MLTRLLLSVVAVGLLTIGLAPRAVLAAEDSAIESPPAESDGPRGTTNPPPLQAPPTIDAVPAAPVLIAPEPPTPLVRSLLQEAVAREHGEAGFLRDPVRAVELYCRAARLGNAEAQYSLGWIFANGRGVAPDEAIAATLFRMAAAQGYSHADKLLDRFPPGEPRLPTCMTEASAKPAAPMPSPNNASASQATAKALAAAVAKARGQMSAKQREVEVVAVINELPTAKRRIANMIRWLAPEYSIDTRLALALVRAESGFDPQARSPKNALGVMQLIPATAERFNVRNAYDPIDNIRGGLAYMRWLLAYYRGHVPYMLAAYNAGEGAVDRYGGLPPYLETHDYVRRIRTHFADEDHPFDERITRASPMLGRAARTR